MSYPIGNETPDGFRGIGDITGLQDVTPPGGGGSIRNAAEGVRGNFFTNVLGGFGSLMQALGSFGSDILTALLGGAAGQGGFLGGISDWANGNEARISHNEQIATDHTAAIQGISERLDRDILQGKSTTYATGNATHTIGQGVTWIDFIIIGAGGGGGGGVWNFLATSRYLGGGGGGGGEMHFGVPRSAFGDTIQVAIAPGGAGGSAGGNGGYAAADTWVGTAPNRIGAGGGEGGRQGNPVVTPAKGGFGMVEGGGGAGVDVNGNIIYSSASISLYSLNGGGGGGGNGAWWGSPNVGATPGSAGGVSPGGGLHQNGTNASGIVATGAGGGGGSNSNTRAGNGGSPGGGGGGGRGGAGIGEASAGGAGGPGMIFIIERV